MLLPGFLGPSYVSQSPIADQEDTINFYLEKMESQGANTRFAMYPTPGVEQLVSQTQIGPPVVPPTPVIANVGAAGATTYGYKVVAKDAIGATLPSAEGTTATGNATLDVTNYNTVTWTAVVGAAGYDVYRTTGTPSAGLAPPVRIATDVVGLTASDQNIGGVQADPPTFNTTGVGSLPPGPGKAHYFDPNTEREFAVIGAMLYEMTFAGVLIPLGVLAVDANPATICGNGDGGQQLFVTAGGNGYCYDLPTETLTLELTGEATQGFFLDGYFGALDADTSTIRLSDLLDGTTWDPTQFAQRSSAADRWVAAKVNGRFLWLFGSQTSEPWWNAGTSTFPLAPYNNIQVQYGIAAPFSAEIVNGALTWLSSTTDGQGVILSSPGFSPARISTYPVEFAISNYETVTDGIGDAYFDLGHHFYVLTFPDADATWATDPALGPMGWHKRGTWIAENSEYTAWRPAYHAFAFQQHRMLDFSSGAVYRMSSTYGFDVEGRPIRRVRRAPSLFFQNKRIKFGAFELILEPGLGLPEGDPNNPPVVGSDPQVVLVMSNDGGKTWGNEQRRSAGKQGQYGTRVIWQRGGQARKRVYEVVMTDPIPWRLIDATVEVPDPPKGAVQGGRG